MQRGHAKMWHFWQDFCPNMQNWVMIWRARHTHLEMRVGKMLKIKGLRQINQIV